MYRRGYLHAAHRRFGGTAAESPTYHTAASVAHPDSARSRPRRAVTAAVALLMLVTLALAACGGSSTTTTTTSPARAPATTTTSKSTAGSFGDGTHVVGQTLKPGTYRAAQPTSTCYWERLSGFSGSLSDTIANENTGDPTLVTIAPTDKGFKTSGCGDWTPDLSQITSSKTSIPAGMYIVNTDIEPGTYQAPGGDGCYWARLSGFGGSTDSVIANDNPTGSTVVTIASTDKGFQSHGCGTFTKTATTGETPPGSTATAPPPPSSAGPTQTGSSGGSRSCDQNISVNSVTSCPFADNVFKAYASDYKANGPQPKSTVSAYSPVTSKTYTMTCANDGTTVTCTGGNNSFVTFPLKAAQVY